MENTLEKLESGDRLSENKDDGNTGIYVRVILIEQYGMLHTIWLPDTIEGRYRFWEDTGEGGKLPIYIEGVSDQWIAYVEKGASFRSADGKELYKKIISNHMLEKIHYHGLTYVLFVEMQQAAEHQFIPYYLDGQKEYKIGRRSDCDICYPRGTVSREHAFLKKSGEFWYIIDNNSTNGVYFNGRRVKSARLHNGDMVFIMGLYILMGSGFIAINNKNDRVRINTPNIRRIYSYDSFIYPQYEIAADDRLYDRQPHKQVQISPNAIEIEMPPMPLYGSKVPMLLRMGSPMVMGGRAIMTGNIALALTSLIFPVLTQGITEKDRREYEEKRILMYRKYLSDKIKEIRQEKKQEEQLLNECYPELSRVLHFALTRERLWERQKRDDNFLNIRIGYGSFPMIAQKKYEERKLELEPDSLTEEMYKLAEHPVLLNNVPVTLSLKTDVIVGVLGAQQQIRQLLKHMAMQLVLTHSYDEVKLILLLDAEDIPVFDQMRYVPHSWDNDNSIRFFALTQSDALRISEYLSKELETLRDKDQKKHAEGKMPAYAVFALSKQLFECVEVFKELLLEKEYCGVSVVAAFDGIPKECSKIIDMREGAKLVDLIHSEVSEQEFMLDPCDKKLADDGMRALMQTKLKMDSKAYLLPDMLTFLEMYGVSRVEHLNPAKRWEDNNPVKSLSALVGIGTDGRHFTLDLHEKRQGPHGLVAGMTGSGKSEFLITYILSMAVNYSPDEVAFILIDYKGGGLADAFEDKENGIHLPHLVGTVTNLDGASVQRSLMSIKSELMRRQRIFKEAKVKTREGTMDIYDYQRLYRSKRVSEPMPHLFIISDEFAELKQQQQEFMDELISAARIGRSLGVHLILATQKPGGVVNDQIWSNTRFRVCLRVQDRGDSMEMLKRPEAAELKHTGRFYLQVGYNEYFAMGQSAWGGADYIPQDELIVDQDCSIQFIDNVGQTILDVKPYKDSGQAEGKQVAAVVRYLSDLAKRENIRPRRLWTAPLPNMIEFETFAKQVQEPEGEGIYALIGMVDDPEYQRQFPLYLRLLDFHNMMIAGAAGSGKSTFLRTMLYSLISRYSPQEVNYYMIDLSDGALSGYKSMPHCGAYLTEENEKDIGRLLNFIHDLIARRKKLFAQAEITDFDVYRQMHPLPLVLVIVDGFMNVKGLNGGEAYFMMFQDYLREGTGFGIRFVLTCNHDNEVGAKSKQELDYRIALQAKDRYEYSDILDRRCTFTPPALNGRGICVHEERLLEYHVAMLDCDRLQQDRANLLRERLSRLAQSYVDDVIAEQLPMPDFDQDYECFCKSFEKERIPLGYSLTDMKITSMPFQQLHSISLYFGNPKGVVPIFRNLLTAAEKNNMDVFIVQRQVVSKDGQMMNSIFDANAEEYAASGFKGNLTMYDCTQEKITELSDMLMKEIRARNVYRDEYSVSQGISLERKGRSRKAAKYIRKHSAPIFVIIESFADFCGACRSEEGSGESELEGLYQVYFNQMFGYNIYFAAGFYPEDDSKALRSSLLKAYNPEDFLLLFGGRYNKAQIPNLPYEVTKIDAVQQQYNRFWMKYREAFYPIIMPCGQIETVAEDEDEAGII